MAIMFSAMAASPGENFGRVDTWRHYRHMTPHSAAHMCLVLCRTAINRHSNLAPIVSCAPNIARIFAFIYFSIICATNNGLVRLVRPSTCCLLVGALHTTCVASNWHVCVPLDRITTCVTQCHRSAQTRYWRYIRSRTAITLDCCIEQFSLRCVPHSVILCLSVGH